MKTSSLVLARAQNKKKKKKKITATKTKVPKKDFDVPIKDFGMITEDRRGEKT